MRAIVPRCALPMPRRPGEQNAAMTERALVSPPNPRVELTFVCASHATSWTSTDLTSLAQGSTQAFYMPCRFPAGRCAAGALILTLGVFCFVLERGDAAGAASLDPAEPARYRAPPQVPSWRRILYFTCGGLVLLSGSFALYTGVWPTSWSTGWSSLYLFEAVAVSAFGIAWITAAAVRAITIQQRVVADLVRQRGSEDPATRTAWTRLAALYGSTGHTPQATAALRRITDPGPPPTPDSPTPS
jgi:hypothetical protein